MKRPIRPSQTLARACALSLAIATCAHAAEITAVKEPTVVMQGLMLSLHPEQATRVEFGELFLGATSLFRMEVAAIAPGNKTTMVVGVPEPSAWLMMGIGLVGVSVMRRRRPTHH